MKQALIVITAFLGFLAVGSANAGNVYNKPGMWETTTTMTMEGMPAGMPGQRPYTHRHCLTKKDMEYTPKPGGPDADCDIKKTRISSNKMRMTATCRSHGMTSTAVGEVTFSSTSSKGHFDITTSGGPGGKMVMHQTFTSRRIGDCPK